MLKRITIITSLFIALFGSLLLQARAQSADRLTPAEATIEITAEPVHVSPFNLIAPAKNTVFVETQKPAVFIWEDALNATGYRFMIQKLNDDKVIDISLDRSICSGGQCSYTLSATEQAVLQTKQYKWKVIARGGVEPVKATNAPGKFNIIPTSAELLTDGNLESLSAWIVDNTGTASADRLMCGKAKYPAFEGACTFLFKGNADGSASRISQIVKNEAWLVNGSLFTLSAWIDPQNAAAGQPFARVYVRYSDGTKDKLELQIPNATGGYQNLQTSTVLDLNTRTIKSVRVDLLYKASGKRYLVDQVSLITTAPAGQ